MNVKEFILDKLNLYLEKKTNTKLVFDTLKKLMPYEVGFELIRLGEKDDLLLFFLLLIQDFYHAIQNLFFLVSTYDHTMIRIL